MHLKRILTPDRLRAGGLSGASNEFSLAAAAQSPAANGEVVYLDSEGGNGPSAKGDRARDALVTGTAATQALWLRVDPLSDSI